MSSLSWLDDSDWSIDPEDEPTRLWIPVTGAIVGFVLLVAIWANQHFKYDCGPKDYLPEYQKCSIVYVKERR